MKSLRKRNKIGREIVFCISLLLGCVVGLGLSVKAYAGCPDGKFLYQGRCVWESEIRCPDGEQFDRVLLKCRSCESFRKVWDPKYKCCGCGPCQVEVGGVCRSCYEDGMDCIDGECVETRKSREYQESWRNPPETFYYEQATSMDEVRGHRKLFVETVQDTEAQLGQKIDLGFSYCVCKGRKGFIVWAQAMGKTSVRDLAKKTAAAADRDCGGCLGPPVIDLLNEF